MYYNRNLIGADKSAVTPKDASGIFDLRSQEKHQRAQSWPGSVESYLTYTINYTGTPFEIIQSGSIDISIDWGDGSSETTNLDNTAVTHTYSTNGIYDVKIDLILGSYYHRPKINNTSSASRDQIVKIKFGRHVMRSFDSSFSNCDGLEEVIAPYTSSSSLTSLRRTFKGCTSLKVFPFIETKNISSFESVCEGCALLTAFPRLDFAASNKFTSAWKNCTSLTDFPPNMFDKTRDFSSTSHFNNAWYNCALTAQSIENILVSLDANGSTSVTLTISGGTNAAYSTWSQAAKDALTSLQNKSWTVAYNS